ncbi:PAS domain-containing protein [Methanoregula sp.]|uniref:PAS domain-containing protein n=1 Tax=Methanoregula sp. TaxID=2052170 RepID=UPI002C80D165|nr:PAS domain-containing protein [Methanoregula sp.]HVP97592.1 PAS domain-containing protein [Methanoregula sp.]
MESETPEKERPGQNISRPVGGLGRIFAMAPVRICLVYFVFGFLWIIFSDNLFLSLPVPRQELILISSIKGTVFIIVTTLLLFLLIRHFTRQWEEKNEELRTANDRLREREEELRIQNEALALSQAEWEITYNSISDWICLIDPDGRILRTNRSIEPLLGIPPEQAIGRKCHDLVHGSACPVPSCPRLRMLVTKKRETIDLQSLQHAGWLQITVDPVFDSKGNLISAVHVVREITDRMREQKALEQAKKKLYLLNYVTFNEIQNSVFTLWGFQQFVRERVKEDSIRSAFAKEDELLSKITRSLKFAQAYQNLGLKPPAWQDVRQVFLLAISHLDFLSIKHDIRLDGLEIFADPLLEQVLVILAENTLFHGKKATQVTLRYTVGPGSITLIYEDDGVGIPEKIKEEIFSPDFQKTKAIGLFLAQEILEITGITIRETGIVGQGVRFEFTVPRGVYRFPAGNNP